MQIRLDALACLRTLALNNPKSLYPHWHLFLSDSPYARSRKTLITLIETDPSISVKTRAVQALDALIQDSTPYLAIAEDRPTKASFTSLSSKLGEIVSELHSGITTLLASAASAAQPELESALLRLAKTIDEIISIAATSALSSILKNISSHSTSPQRFDATFISSTALSLLNLPRPESTICELWELLAISSISSLDYDLHPALALLHSTITTSSLQIQLAQISFISTVFSSPPITSSSTPLSLAPYSTSLLQILRVALESDKPSLRVLACGVLGSPSFEGVGGIGVDRVKEAIKLVIDEDAGDSSVVAGILAILTKKCEEAEPVKATASWALANCLDLVVQSCGFCIVPQIPESGALIEQALQLVAVSNGEKVQMNGLRALGCLVRLSSNDVPIETILCVVQALTDCVTSGPVKVSPLDDPSASPFFRADVNASGPLERRLGHFLRLRLPNFLLLLPASFSNSTHPRSFRNSLILLELQTSSSSTTGHLPLGYSFDYDTTTTALSSLSSFDFDSAFKLQDGALDLTVPVSTALDFNVPFDFSTTSFPPFPLDRTLESPLGLDPSSSYSDFLVSPMFSEASDTVPELDGSLDFSYPLFPSSTTASSSAPVLAYETNLRPNPSPPTRPTFPQSNSSSFSSTSSNSSSASTPAPARPTKALPKPNGFRAGAATTPLLPLDAPIQPRSYLLPSATSRKRKSTPAEREIAKRLAEAEASAAPAPEIPDELIAAVERKRTLNSISARKSRMRKQERLGELEGENEKLLRENVELKRRVGELEERLRGLGEEV
ncbi:hypothetical protein P7C70_g7716, partial [Phenoliferia sp. Uapishka_3]